MFIKQGTLTLLTAFPAGKLSIPKNAGTHFTLCYSVSNLLKGICPMASQEELIQFAQKVAQDKEFQATSSLKIQLFFMFQPPDRQHGSGTRRIVETVPITRWRGSRCYIIV
jgi:hypothetical protein